MSPSDHNMVGLVELTDAEELLDRFGRSSFGDIRQAFEKRLQDLPQISRALNQQHKRALETMATAQ